MEWVETTARSVDEAMELALDQLGVVADEAEFEILESPRPGLFGRIRGEARVRARVRPAPVRPKQDRRRGRRPSDVAAAAEPRSESTGARRAGRRPTRPASVDTPAPTSPRGREMTDEQPAEQRESDNVDGAVDGATETPTDAPPVDVEGVRDAALDFVGGLTAAFGFETTVDAHVDGNEIEVRVDGPSLGLLIGPGGRTLLGIQDLARVAAQRRLGDHETRLRVDVAGYREKRRVALERFAGTVAEQVRATGVARSLDAMPSADRKVLHDALAEIDGVTSRSEGEEPNRRVVVLPAP